MNENYIVIKRDGREESFNFDKIYKHIIHATEGLKVSPNDIVERLKIRMKKRMKSSEIQKSLITAAGDLISLDIEDAQYAAARLLLQDLYKEVYGDYKPVFNYETLKDRINKGIYSDEILDYYTEEEFNDLCQIINFNKDFKFTYLGLSQMVKKYGIKRKGKNVETPQEIFFLIPTYIFMKIEDKIKRKKIIKDYYNELSDFSLFLSTPPMVGIRTRMKGWTSCAGIDYGDSIESFGNASKSMFTLITKLRAGIGANPGGIRGIGADIGSGFEEHTGIIPYLKVYEAISRSSTQPNSGRSGAITNYYPFFHWEIEDILPLKNNKGSDETSVRHSDHAIIFNDLFYERYFNGEDITLFHMNEVGDLYDHIGMDNFKEKYEALERKRNIKKKKISAKSLYDRYFNERYITARVYKVNANEFQRHGAFNLPLKMSNLCTEIELPAFPDEERRFYVQEGTEDEVKGFIEALYLAGKWYEIYKYLLYDIVDDENLHIINEFKKIASKTKTDKFNTLTSYNFGEIFSCILGGINFGNLPKNVEERRKKLKKLMYLQVRFLDTMIDEQDYVNIKPFEKFTKNRRALGISPGNLFYLLAKYGFNYNSQEARDLINEIMEEMLYFGIYASWELAVEKGPCTFFKDTKYSKGIFPIDTYNKNVDKLVSSSELKLDWKELKEKVKKDGMRNSTLLTAVPSSNSSRPANMISGINPPQNLEYAIEDQKMRISGVLPEVKKYKEFYKYNSAWNLNVLEYWKLIAVFQKFIDQTISLNEYVDFTKYPKKKIPKEEVIKRDLFTVKYGLKSLYYALTKTDEDDKEGEEDKSNCSGGGCTL